MVLRYTKEGIPYGVPPYTEAENRDFYRRIENGPVAFTRPQPPAAPAPGPRQGRRKPPARRPSARGTDR
jgi:hypothetical protein